MKTCPHAPTNKKEYITDVGKTLVAEHGKQQFYTPEQVKKATKKSRQQRPYEPDWSCWAMCTFSSHTDFDRYHESTGEVCDYAAMKTEMLSGLSLSTSSNWTDIPDLDLDASWLDFGDLFGGFLEGIGDFVCGIFEGI